MIELEASTGIDFSTFSQWIPGDTVIYDAGTPTNSSLVTAASRKINSYTQTTFSNMGSTPGYVTEVCNSVVLRLLGRRSRFLGSLGFDNVSDDFAALALDSIADLDVQLTDEEKRILDQGKSPALRATSDTVSKYHSHY